MFRWFGLRIRAGDRLPNFELPIPVPGPFGQAFAPAPGSVSSSASLLGPDRSFLPSGRNWGGKGAINDEKQAMQVYPYDHGWMLLLFEGQADSYFDIHNGQAHMRKPLSNEELHALGERLFKAISMIDSMYVIPLSHPATEVLGVAGQCLFFVRPDGHVALRSEPACEEAVYGFLESFLGVEVPDHPDPASSPVIDWIYAMPVAILAMVVFMLAALLNDQLLISLHISPDEQLRGLG